MTKIHILNCDCGDYYITVDYSLDKSKLEAFIKRVEEYDGKYPEIRKAWQEETENAEELLEEWEDNHPLNNWSDEINGECGSMGYYLAEYNYKSYAKKLYIVTDKLDKTSEVQSE